MAAKTKDSTVDTANQMLQGGSDWVVAGTLNIDRTNGGKLYQDATEVSATGAELNAATGQVASCTLSPAAGSTNVCLVTVTFKDANGVTLTFPATFDIWLSDAASGAALTTTTASGAVAAGASGADFGTLTSKKALRSQCTAAGVYILSITDSGKTGFYVCVSIGGKVFVSAQLVSGNYG
jgi:hypothetical protein